MSALTIGGLPGTGTTTLSRLVAARTGLPHAYAGGIFREEARRHGLSLPEFGRLCQEDPAVDRALDERQVRLLQEGGVVLEGRLSGWLAHRQGLSALKVWLVCEDEERFRRLAERDGGGPADQAALAREREASEADRYRRYYGADLGDLDIYDMVLDSTTATPEQLADRVMQALQEAEAAQDAERMQDAHPDGVEGP